MLCNTHKSRSAFPRRFCIKQNNQSRYRNSEQCEVSDPDEWAMIHCGPAGDDRDATDEGEQEF